MNRFYDPDTSATSQMLTDLARGLAAAGFDVHVVTSRQRHDGPGAPLDKEETRHGVHVHRVATTRFGRSQLPGRAIDYASFYAASALMLLRLLRCGDVLVAKTDPPLLSILAAPLAKARRAVLINWQQDVFPEIATRLGANPLPGWLDAVMRRCRNGSLRAAHTNVVIGRRMSEYLAAEGIPQSKLCVIENWADGGVVIPKPASASALRARLNLSDRFVLCYSGNLGRAHEFDTLLGAAEALKADASFVFLIIGSGAKADALKRDAAARALDNFRFLPHQPRDALNDSLAAADVHLVSLLPALEGFVVPSKLYGILAAGRPLIFVGDPQGDVARVIQGAQCGALIAVGDSAGLQALLQRLSADRMTLARQGERARQVFDREYALPLAVDRWIALIKAAAS